MSHRQKNREASRPLGFLLAALVLAGMTGCRMPGGGDRESAFPGFKPLSPEELPEQALIQVHLFGMRETVPSEDLNFPSLGFRYDEEGFTATSEPETAAGTAMPIEEFASRLRRAIEANTAVIYLAPTFAITLGHSASTANTKEESYVHNVVFDRKGNYKTTRKTFSPGARLTVQCRPVEATDAVLVNLDLAIESQQAERHRVADRLRSETAGSLPPMELDLLHGTNHRIHAATPLRFDESAVVAHYVKQYNEGASLSSARRYREHLVCTVTLKRYGLLPDPGTVQKPVKKTPCFSNTLIWSSTDAAPTPAADIEEEEAAPAGGTSELEETLQKFRATPGTRFFTLGIVTVADHPVCFEVSDHCEYVSDVGGAPAEARSGPYAVERAVVRSGARFEPCAETDGENVKMALKGFLAEPWTLQPVEEKRSSLRVAPEEKIEETYHLAEPTQIMANLREEFPILSERAQLLKPAWALVKGREHTPIEPDPGRIAIFRSQRLTWPEPQEAPVPEEATPAETGNGSGTQPQTLSEENLSAE